MVNRFAYCAHGSAYETSFHKLADTGQIILFEPQNPECEPLTHIKQVSELVGAKSYSILGFRLFVRINHIYISESTGLSYGYFKDR